MSWKGRSQRSEAVAFRRRLRENDFRMIKLDKKNRESAVCSSTKEWNTMQTSIKEKCHPETLHGIPRSSLTFMERRCGSAESIPNQVQSSGCVRGYRCIPSPSHSMLGISGRSRMLKKCERPMDSSIHSHLKREVKEPLIALLKDLKLSDPERNPRHSSCTLVRNSKEPSHELLRDLKLSRSEEPEKAVSHCGMDDIEY